jgi:4-amino-4-deoxy-L-arabinose transferase-like glycosyltransferase
MLVALAATLLFGIALGARDLWNPNEPSYGQVVVEMIESGHWLLPELNGEVFAEKPILSYWLGAIACTLAGGVSESALRAPLVAVGVTSTLLVYLLVAGYASRRAALLGSAVFATEYLVWWTSRTVQMDSFVLLSALATTLALTRRLDGDWSARKAWIIVGLSAGLGFAAKGPVTSVVPAAIVLAYCLAARRPLWSLWRGLPWGLALFALTGLPWYAALLASGQTAALHELLLHQNVTRFLGAWDHKQPWYYFLEYFWVSYVPWSWFVPVAAFLGPTDERERRGWILGWMWILLPLVFFSLSQSKREPYLLPIAPAIALLTALVFERLVAGNLGRGQRRACLALCAAFGALFLAAGAYVSWRPAATLPQGFPALTLQVTLLGCGLLVGAGLAWRSRPWAAPAGLLASMVVLYIAASIWILPAADPLKSQRVFAREAAPYLTSDVRLHGFFGPIPRKWQRGGGYAFYLGRRLPHLDSEAELLAAWDRPGPICVITEEPLHGAPMPPLADARTVVKQTIGAKSSILLCRGIGPEAAVPVSDVERASR